ncbi:MAG: hypothetical protein V1889_01185 [archaeon]
MVRAIMIVEIAGRPAEHLKNALAEHIGILNKVNDITVHSIKLSEPKEIENSNGMLTCFAEADFETTSFGRLSETMFDFMPSSVEIIEPTNVSLSMHEATDLLNNISGRMHRYDEIAKIAGEKLRQMAEREKELVAKMESGEIKIAKKKVAKKKSSKKK